MDSLLITPTSEAEFNLLVALFEKMRIQARAITSSELVEPTDLAPRTQAECTLVTGIGELREIRAGRQQAQTLVEFWQEVAGE